MMAIWPFSLVKGSTPSPKTSMPMPHSTSSNLPSHNRTANRSADVPSAQQHLAVTPLERKPCNLSVTTETGSQPRFVVNTEARLKRMLFAGVRHKVQTYLEYHSACPLVEIGTPTPSPASECASHRNQRGAGGTLQVHTHLRVKGGGVPIRTTREKA
jgi:hypothetical protein